MSDRKSNQGSNSSGSLTSLQIYRPAARTIARTRVLSQNEMAATHKNRSDQRHGSWYSKNVWKSLQSCKPQENEEKLEGLIEFYKKRKSHHKVAVPEALLFVLRQLRTASSHTDPRGRGFLRFDDAYGLYSGFFKVPIQKEEFCDHLLHSEHGLRVFISTIQGTRYKCG